MGLSVALSMSQQDWKVFILDFNESAGTKAVGEEPKLSFAKVDVSSWESLASAFDRIFTSEGRLDFVFANAGILQMQSFYDLNVTSPPSEISQLSIDINLKAVVSTTYLARHYFLNPANPCRDPVLVITASIASFVSKKNSRVIGRNPAYRIKYAQEFNPLYTASKAGVLGFMRSIASPFYKDGIRTYAICPGTVRTTLLHSSVYDSFPEEYLTPVETIVSTVDTLVKGGNIVDSRGERVLAEDNYGVAVEVFGKEIFFRPQMEYINDGMRQICEAASLDNHRANFGK